MKGDVWHTTGGVLLGKTRYNDFVVEDWHTGKCVTECITHTCRCCGFQWETKPLTGPQQEQPPYDQTLEYQLGRVQLAREFWRQLKTTAHERFAKQYLVREVQRLQKINAKG
jgi:hypothetical protein